MGYYFKPIIAHNITDEHEKWLDLAAQTLQNGAELADLYLEASKGLLNLWEWGNDNSVKGVVLTKRFREPNGDTVYIASLAGEELTPAAPVIWAGLKAYREETGARFISYRTMRKGAERLMKKLTGAEEVAKEFTVDFAN